MERADNNANDRPFLRVGRLLPLHDCRECDQGVKLYAEVSAHEKLVRRDVLIKSQIRSTDPSSWSFNVNELTGVNIIATIVDYHNTTSTPIDVTAHQADAIATTQPLPQVTTTGTDETIVHIVGYGGNVTPTAPAGDSQRAATHSTAVPELMSDRHQPQGGQLSLAKHCPLGLCASRMYR